MNGARKLLKNGWKSRAANAILHRGFNGKLDPYVLVDIEKNAVLGWNPPVNEELIKSLRIPLYDPKKFQLKKNDHVKPFLDATLSSGEQNAHVVFLKRMCLTFAILYRKQLA